MAEMDGCDMEDEMCVSNMPSGSNKFSGIAKENVHCVALPSTSKNIESRKR